MIWLIGNGGMLGTEASRVLDALGVAWKGSDKEVDIRHFEELEAFASQIRPSWIVNCAAFTAVDAAEEAQEDAFALNAEAPRLIGTIASMFSARFVHISTDYVFDGSKSQPYKEEDPISPLGTYGKSKAAGELAALASCSRTYVLRTAWLYGSVGNNFVRKMLSLMKTSPQVKVVADQYGSPTNARDLAEVIAKIISSARDQFGTYHVTNEGKTSWYEFARAIREEALLAGVLSGSCEVLPIPGSQFPSKAVRPKYSVLSKEKIKEAFGIIMPQWRDSLRRFIREEYLSEKS